MTGTDRKQKGIVVADFDVARSYPNEPERKRLRIAGDWAFFNEAFCADEEEEGWDGEAVDEEDNSAGHLRGDRVRVLAVEEEGNGTGSFDGDGFLYSFALNDRENKKINHTTGYSRYAQLYAKHDVASGTHQC